jgi:hypothetical protein
MNSYTGADERSDIMQWDVIFLYQMSGYWGVQNWTRKLVKITNIIKIL